MAVKPKIPLDVDKALELMEQAVEAKGADYIYEQPPSPKHGDRNVCLYWYDNAPSCIVGHALLAAGITPAALKRADKFEGGSGIYTLASEGIIELHPDVTAVFSTAQNVQDRGDSWGKALELARNTAASLKARD